VLVRSERATKKSCFVTANMSLEIAAAAYIYINLASKKKKTKTMDGGKRSCIIVDQYPVEVAYLLIQCSEKLFQCKKDWR
jgi:hypothetical protein